MIFNNNKAPQAINIPFNWVADYFDGSYLSEYDFQSHKPNNFYTVKQDFTLRFGLIGQGMKMYFDNTDGSFHLNGRKVDIVYEFEGKQYVLTCNNEKKDFITYKQAFTEYNNREGRQRSNIESINFGYKTVYKKDDIEMFFQPVVSLPFDSKAFIEIKLTSNKEMNGELVFISRRKEIERFKAPLQVNTSGNMKWTIK
ncbi:hypothetical protein [Sporosarcina sp. FSL W7-1283]|uniref:hypothetical protein n=1 Tax=Sporosarcina sp. FSL W7-1283 TaxID=2921560 RepID=UPI0030FB2DCC